MGLSQNLGNEGDLRRLGAFTVGGGEGGRVVEIVIFKGSHFHCRASRGLPELRCSKSLYWTCSTHLWDGEAE